jgi:hypothetical protein
MPHQQLYDLRPLKTVDVHPPDYKIIPHQLVDGCVEKEVKFVGIIPDIPHALDPTNRTEVLRIIDRGKRDKYLTRTVQDAIFCLSVRYIKLLTRDKAEDLLLRLPIHQVAAMSYICEDDHHILSIKFGEFDLKRHQLRTADDSPACNLAVVYCDSRRSAEELCAGVDQCFQSIYTDATMHFFDRSLLESARTSGVDPGVASVDYSFTDKSASSTPRVSTRTSHEPPATLGFLSHSSLDLGTLSSATSRSLSRATGRGSDVELSAAANQLIMDYMKKLYNKLNADELQRFALLVKAWHNDLSFPDFCNSVLDLYGPDRKYLLIGMQPFIPAKDLTYFEHFIERVGLSSSQLEPQPPPSRGYRAPISSVVAWNQKSSSASDSNEELSSNGGGGDRFAL